MHFSCFIPQISTLAILLGVASAAVEIRFMRNVADCSGTNYAYWYDIPIHLLPILYVGLCSLRQILQRSRWGSWSSLRWLKRLLEFQGREWVGNLLPRHELGLKRKLVLPIQKAHTRYTREWASR